jgi:sulfite reductase (NADPH) flavoprotein alpha-component
VFHYFGYGSNMNLVSLKAKGVVPRTSTIAELPAWELIFNVHHWFKHEGGVGNIRPSSREGARVLGVAHVIDDEDLAKLDAVESYGVGYDRITVPLRTADGPLDAITYIGIDSYLDDSCLPTRRYLNILVAGAETVGLDANYVDALRRHPIHQPGPYPPFEPPPDSPSRGVFDAQSLSAHPTYTALDGHVFDMKGARWQHDCLVPLLGGKDMTLFHLKRLDSSDGSETLDTIRARNYSAAARDYLNAYLHEYNAEYTWIGTFDYGS